MTKLIKLSLISAVLATGAMANTNLIQDKLSESSTVTFKADSTIDTTGILEMTGAGVIDANGKTITNKGKVDISAITDFSGYKGTVTGEDGSSVVIPGPKVTGITVGNESDFTCNGTYALQYNSGANVSLTKTDNTIATALDSGSTYADANAAKSALGINFAGEPTLDPLGTQTMTLAEVVEDALNIADNSSATFDIGDENLASTTLELTEDKDIHFGLSGEENLTITGGKVALKGDCSGLTGKLASDSDVTFENKAATGVMEIKGKLTFSKPSTDPLSISTSNEIKAGKFVLEQGVTLTSSAPITIGWGALMYTFTLPADGWVESAGDYKNYFFNFGTNDGMKLNSIAFNSAYLRIASAAISNGVCGEHSSSQYWALSNESNVIKFDTENRTIDYSGLIGQKDSESAVQGDLTDSRTPTCKQVYDFLVAVEKGEYELLEGITFA